MTYFKDLIEELKEKGKQDRETNGIRTAKEQAIYKDLLRQKKCNKCPRTENLTLDHIVPKDLLTCMGVDIKRQIVEGNYQLLCSTCNQFKSNRLDFSIPETKQLLLKLLEDL